MEPVLLDAAAPCLAQPIPVAGNHLPASLQLVGPWSSENLLLATAELIATANGLVTATA